MCVIGFGVDVCSAETPVAPTEKPLEGYLGAGVVVSPKYAGSASSRTWPAPLASIEYRETAYIHIDRAGVRLWSTDDRKMALGLGMQPRFGFSAKDGMRLSGLATRHDRIEGGPNFEWELPWVSVSAGYFTGLSEFAHGAVAQLSLFHQLRDDARWDVGAYLDFERLNKRSAQYYFGISPDEATASHSVYEPSATVNSTIGFAGAYRFDNGYALLFGSSIEVLGSSAARSPIVERSNGLTTYLGLGIVFQ